MVVDEEPEEGATPANERASGCAEFGAMSGVIGVTGMEFGADCAE